MPPIVPVLAHGIEYHADQNIAGGVNAAFDVGVEHGYSSILVDGVDLVDRVDGGRDDRFWERTR